MTVDRGAVPVEQDEVDEFVGSEPSENPLAGTLPVHVSVPARINIEMVQIQDLGDYELWFAIASFLASVASGSFVAWIGANSATPREETASLLLGTTVLFAVMFAVATVVTWTKRKRIRGDTTTIPFIAQRRPASPD